MMLAHRQRMLLLALAFSLCCGYSARAAEIAAHPIVAGFERFYNVDKSDAVKGGQLLLGELNCTSCHAPGDAAVSPKQAPILDGVAGRVRLSHLKKFLKDPQGVKPGTTMPNPFADDPDKATKVEALVHFLATTGSLKQTRTDARAWPSARTCITRSAASPATARAITADSPKRSSPSWCRWAI